MFNPSDFTVAALYALCLLVPGPAHALKPIAPESIKADTDATLQATTSSADYTKYVKFDAFLAATTPDGGHGPICILLNGTAIPQTTNGYAEMTVTIPASVGPAASVYSIGVQAYSDPSDLGVADLSDVLYSETFRLDGATAEWSEYESASGGAHFLTFAGLVPCSAYDCTRQCSMRHFPENTRNISSIEKFNPDTYESTFDCVAACPGVVYPSWSDVVDGDSYEQDDDGVRGDGNGDATLTMSFTWATAMTLGASVTDSSSVTRGSSRQTSAASGSGATITGSRAVSTTATASAASSATSSVQSGAAAAAAAGVLSQSSLVSFLVGLLGLVAL